jgi:hypothetical protein
VKAKAAPRTFPPTAPPSFQSKYTKRGGPNARGVAGARAWTVVIAESHTFGVVMNWENFKWAGDGESYFFLANEQQSKQSHNN